MGKLITIVINCYNRKEYLIEAVNSALNQSTSRDLYDVMVIKNFSDGSINEYLSKNGVKNIETENETTGQWFLIAAKQVGSKFISFLDDDDIIHSDKISILLRILKEYPHSTFIHNSSERKELIQNKLNFNDVKIENIMDDGVSTFKKSLREKRYFNLSSITIDKDVILVNEEFVKETNHGTDMVLYAASKLTDGNRMHYEECLTFYRVHDDSQGNFRTDGQENYEETKRVILPNHVRNWGLISYYCRSMPIGKYAFTRVISSKIWLNIVSQNMVYKISFKDMMQGIKLYRYYPLIVIFLSINLLDRFSHRLIKNIYFKFLFSRAGWRIRDNI